jgi:hypothetical protein
MTGSGESGSPSWGEPGLAALGWGFRRAADAGSRRCFDLTVRWCDRLGELPR